MNQVETNFNNITLLVTHYNRSKSLERLLKAFRDYNCSFYEIIVSDDGSKDEHISYLENLNKEFDFKLLKAARNSGLGNNINKGQDVVTSKYTLYVQEDFIPLNGFEKPIKDALNILEEDSNTDTVRFYSYLDYPKTIPFKNGFSEMIFDPWSTNLHKFPMYSDHPHLRRSDFLKKFGRYNENKHSDKIEFDMMISYLRKKGKGYIYDNYKSVFDQANSSDEPSSVQRVSWRNSDNFFIGIVRFIYRQFVYNYTLYLKKY